MNQPASSERASIEQWSEVIDEATRACRPIVASVAPDSSLDTVSAYWTRRQPEAADWLTTHLSQD